LDEERANKDKGQLTVTIPTPSLPVSTGSAFTTTRGASGLRPFIVGTLPEVLEKEPNDDYRKAQPLEQSCVVNGRLEKPGDVDCFSIKLDEGADTRRLDGRQPHARLADGRHPANRLREWHRPRREQRLPRPRPAGNTHGYRGRNLHRPHLRLSRGADGTIGFAGAETFIYRLTVTTGPFVEHAFPLAVAREKPGEVELIGWNIADAVRKVTVPAVEGGARHGVSREGGEHRDGAPRTATRPS